MFPCVWLHFKKFSGKYFLVFGKEEGKHKSENTKQKPQPGKKIINDHITRSRSRRNLDRDRRRDLDRDRRRDRDRADDRRRDRDLDRDR